MTVRRRIVTHLVTATLLCVVAACGPLPSPPDAGAETVPVSDLDGTPVGTVRVDDLDRAAEDGSLAEVHDDGELVGHIGPDGFVPLDGPR